MTSFGPSRIKRKPDLEGMGLNLIMHYRLPLIIISIVSLDTKPLSVLETKTLGRCLGRLLKYHLMA
jgi:hypothetical protein